MSNLNEDLKRILLAGVGAIATTTEKGKQVVDTLVEKGQLTVEQGKVLNEELKRDFKVARENFKNKNENVTKEKNHEEIKAEIYKNVDKLSKEEIADLQSKLIKLQEENAE